MRARYMLTPPPRPCPCARWMHQHLLPTRETSGLANRNKRRAWVSLFEHRTARASSVAGTSRARAERLRSLEVDDSLELARVTHATALSVLLLTPAQCRRLR